MKIQLYLNHEHHTNTILTNGCGDTFHFDPTQHEDLASFLHGVNDGWIKYDPKDESTWPDGVGFLRCIVCRTTSKKEVFEAMFNSLTKDWQQTNFERLGEITHWMPLPSKPLEI